MSAFLATVLLLTPAGLDLFKHHKTPSGPCCDTCGTETARVHALIYTMQTHPKWRQRDNAAHALRKYDAHCHPEIGSALAATMLHDCEEEVREEAAESLAKLAPCQPDVHAALVQASKCDPDHATRKWANRALRNLKDECVAACSVCEPVPGQVIVTTRPAVYNLPAGAPLPVGGTVVLPAEPYLEPGATLPPGSSPSLPPLDAYQATPLDGLPPVEIAPPELPPNPSPFLPGASRDLDDEAEVDETPVRRASTQRDSGLLRFGQRLLGR